MEATPAVQEAAAAVVPPAQLPPETAPAPVAPAPAQPASQPGAVSAMPMQTAADGSPMPTATATPYPGYACVAMAPSTGAAAGTVADPSTAAAAAAGSTTSNRWVLSPEDVEMLANIFKATPYPSRQVRMQLASRLQVQPHQVQMWFQNRRQRVKSRGEPVPKAGSMPGAISAIAATPTPALTGPGGVAIPELTAGNAVQVAAAAAQAAKAAAEAAQAAALAATQEAEQAKLAMEAEAVQVAAATEAVPTVPTE